MRVVSQPSVARSTNKVGEGLLAAFRFLSPIQGRILQKYAEDHYNESRATAFASLAKLSACAEAPGLLATVEESCSSQPLPDAITMCQQTNFTVVRGTVVPLVQAGVPLASAISGYLALVNFGASAPGVLLVLRGSLTDLGSKEELAEGLPGCKGCGIFKRYLDAYASIKEQTNAAWPGYVAYSPGKTMFVAGHGTGGAVASLAAWDAVEEGFTVGTSYLFASPMVGDQVFAEAMRKRFASPVGKGTIYSVTYGKDLVPRSPLDSAFHQWAFEAHYMAFDQQTMRPQICVAGFGEGCGLSHVPETELTNKDACQSPLVNGGSFCQFDDLSLHCMAGQPLLASAKVEEKTFNYEAAARWSRRGAKGKDRGVWWRRPVKRPVAVIRPITHVKQPADDWFNIKTLKAFAALAKGTYCGPSTGIKKVWENTCKSNAGVCSEAGFGIVPGTVQSEGIAYQNELTQPSFMKHTLFFLTAKIRRTKDSFAQKPFVMPKNACVVAFRGSSNTQNIHMCLKAGSMTPLNDPACPGCSMFTSAYDAWHNAFKDRVLSALGKSGCTSRGLKKVFVTGHSLGGAFAQAAFYFLSKLGFDMQLSWSLEGMRVGNEAFLQHLDKLVEGKRPVPLWKVSYKHDQIPRFGGSTFNPALNQFYGRDHFVVHFDSPDVNKYELCTMPAEYAGDSKCGNLKYRYDQLKALPDPVHCAMPYAPEHKLCMMHPSQKEVLGDLSDMAPYLEQCTTGGAL